VDRLLDVLEAADVRERRRGARLEIERRRGPVRAAVTRDLHHPLEAERRVDLAPELGHALDDARLLRCVGERAGKRDVACGERAAAGRQQAVDGKLAGAVEDAVLARSVVVFALVRERLGEQQAERMVLGRQLERSRETLDAVRSHRISSSRAGGESPARTS
jgi:hypothetical protein